MSFNDLFSALGAPLLQQHFGGSVTRYPAGIVGDAETVAGAIFQEQDATADEARGRDVQRNALLTIPSSVAVDARDTWLINEELWSTIAHHTDAGGLTVVMLRLNAPELRTKSGGRVR